MWEVMFWPLVACVILPPLLVYLGLHVVQRGIIFIDIAMAQMASLGFCVGALWHLELDDPRNIAIALGFTLVAAALFSFTNKKGSEVPHEATIGIAYVVAAAAAVLILSRAAHGDEEIKNMLVGNILLVSAEDILRAGSYLGKFLPAMKILNEPVTEATPGGFLPGAAWWFAFVGLLHLVFRRQLCGVSFAREQSHAQGMRVRLWDFLFYALFGLVVTSFVRIAGVLLIFSYLIVPAVCAVLLARRMGARMFVGCIIALIGGVGGMIGSFYADLPSGAAIVCALGILLIIAAFAAKTNRPFTSYILILLGPPLGYIASYFFQPGLIRMFASLGDYIANAPKILIPPTENAANDGLSGMSNQLGHSVFLTGWIGTLVGVILMAVLAMILGMKRPVKKASDT